MLAIWQMTDVLGEAMSLFSGKGSRKSELIKFETW